MPIIMPDTSEAQSQEPIEPGTYHATIKSGASQMSKGEGGKQARPMYVPTLEIQVGDEKRTRKGFHLVSGPGAFTFDQLLRATGETELAEQIKANPGQIPFDTDLLNGREVMVVITHNLYNGQNRDQIQSYLPV
jgi:hypothetical protein